jgi:hypothetical protein
VTWLVDRTELYGLLERYPVTMLELERLLYSGWADE